MYQLIKLGSRLADDALEAGLKWLARRRKNVSKHVGYHTMKAANAARRNSRYLSRAIGRSPHSIFKDPRPAKLVERVLKKPDQIIRQTRNGRLIVEKQFNRVIGKANETVIRVVLDPKTGKIITAFPVSQLLLITRAGAEVPREVYGSAFDDRVIETIERIDLMVSLWIAQREEIESKNRILNLVLDVLIGATPAGDPDEELYVDIHEYVHKQANLMISEVEEATGGVITETHRRSMREQFINAVTGLGVPYPNDE